MNKEDAKRRLKVIELESQRLQEMIEAPEKPKPQHGDFGIEICKGDSYMRLITNPVSKTGLNISNEYGEIPPGNKITTILGNVFDLMKGWSETFEDFHIDRYATGIKIEDEKIKIYACTGDCEKERCYCPLSLNEVEEFYNALGHAIADLKRKENK